MIDKRNRNLIVRAFNLNVCEIAGKDASLCARKTPMSDGRGFPVPSSAIRRDTRRGPVLRRARGPVGCYLILHDRKRRLERRRPPGLTAPRGRLVGSVTD